MSDSAAFLSAVGQREVSTISNHNRIRIMRRRDTVAVQTELHIIIAKQWTSFFGAGHRLHQIVIACLRRIGQLGNPFPDQGGVYSVMSTGFSADGMFLRLVLVQFHFSAIKLWIISRITRKTGCIIIGQSITVSFGNCHGTTHNCH